MTKAQFITYVNNNFTTNGNGEITGGKLNTAMLEVAELFPNYKKLVATVSQNGFNAPTMIILENTFGLVPTWEYIGDGQYDLVFPLNTLVNEDNIYVYSDVRGGEVFANFGGTPIDTQRIRFFTWLGEVNTNNVIYKAPIEIRYYE